MSGRSFFDTNILVYALDPVDLRKAAVAEELLRAASKAANGVISYQVLQEFFNIAFRKFQPPMTRIEAREYLEDIVSEVQMVVPSSSFLERGFDLRERYRLSWYDSLIVAAALEARCEILYTEDLQHRQRFGELLVVNPFL